LKRFIPLAVCTALIALIIAAPAAITGGIHKSVYTLRAEEKSEKFRGTLEMWHIVSFKTPEGSGIGYLKERMRAFEKQNPYVFINVNGLTPDEARQKLASGETPDIVSYPLGFFEDAHSFSPLAADDGLYPAYMSCGKFGETYAYPYMADFYCLAANRDLLTSFPLGNDISYGELSYALANTNVRPLVLTDTELLCPELALAYLHTADSEDIFDDSLSALSPARADISEFLSGSTAAYVCQYSAYYRLAEDDRASVLSLTALPISTYTDAVQLVSAWRSEDAKKSSMCADAAAWLLTMSSQSRLKSTGLLPVKDVPDMYAADIRGEAAMLLGYEGRIPSAFADRESLKPFAMDVFHGDHTVYAKIENTLFH